MNRRHWLYVSSLAMALRPCSASIQKRRTKRAPPTSGDTLDKFLLKDYHPRSIYGTPKTEIVKAKHPVIRRVLPWHPPRRPDGAGDGHRGARESRNLHRREHRLRFTEVRQQNARYPGRSDLWCGFDLTGADQPGFGPNAVTFRKLVNLSPPMSEIDFGVPLICPPVLGSSDVGQNRVVDFADALRRDLDGI
jgi:hypothetical protein